MNQIDINAATKTLSGFRNPSSDANRLTLLQRRTRSSFKPNVTSEFVRTVSKMEINQNDQTMTENVWKKRLDEVKERVLKRRAYLVDLQDKLEEYSKTNTLIVDEEAANKRIKILENKVDNLMIKFNEAMNIKRMYQGLVLTLKHQRTTYDRKIVAMERLTDEKEAEVKAAAEVYQKAVIRKQAISQKYKDYECRRDEVQAQREKYLLNRKLVDQEIESLQRKEMKMMRNIDDQSGEGGNNGRGKRVSMAPRLCDVPVEEGEEQVDYNFLDEFFQKAYDITGARDGKLKSERNHSETDQQRREANST